METEALLCSACGGALDYEGTSVCECKYCGVTNILSGSTIKNVNRINRANQYRQECNFDEAIRIYDEILDEAAPTIDVLWSKTLCQYGIEYVQDPVSNEYKPTLHRIEDEDIFESESFKEAMELADEKQKAILMQDARVISDIQNEYMEIVKNEKPYDVFICFKQTDANGDPTMDSMRGRELYDQLQDMGLKVFFSKVTLKDKLGIQYEPYIFAALKSSSVMVLLVSDADYINATWVKNEWKRFLALKQKDPKKGFFIACEDPATLPRSFRAYEVQKLTEVGALNNLAHNVKDYIEANNPERFRKNASNAAFANVDSLYQVAFELNQNGKFDECIGKLDEIIKLNPTFEEAYWLRLCSRNHIVSKDMEYAAVDFHAETDYISAITLAAESKKKEYERICNECIQNLEGKETFHNKKQAILKEYENRTRGKEKRKEIEAKEKKIRWFSEANAFFQADVVTKKVVTGYVMSAITILIGFIVIASAASDSTASSIYGVFDLLFLTAGVLFCTECLRRYWGALLGIGLFLLDIIIPVSLENAMKNNGAVTGVILGLVLNIVALALVTFLYVVFLMRRKKEEAASKVYRAAFCEYTNMILDDVNHALVETVQERGRNMMVDYYPVKEVDSSNYMRIDPEIRQYLDKECIYVNLSNVFLAE